MKNNSKYMTMGQLRQINRSLKKRERFLKAMRKLQLENVKLSLSTNKLFEKVIRGVTFNANGDIEGE